MTVIRTARWLGVPPWELLGQSYFWTVAAGHVAAAEAEIERKDQEERSHGNNRR